MKLNTPPTRSSPAKLVLTLQRLSRLAKIGCLVLLGIWAIAFIYVSGNRLFYPYCVEWLEGTLFVESLRTTLGFGLYVDPESGWASLGYNPLYLYLVSILIPIFGPSLSIGRVISLSCTLLSSLIVYNLVKRESKSPSAGFIGAFFFIASFPVVGFWYDLARIDSLAIFTMLMGFLILGPLPVTKVRVTLSALLFSLSFITKQTTLPAMCIVFFYLLMKTPKRALLFGALSAFFLSGSILMLQWNTNGWFWHYTYELPAHHVSMGLTYNFFTGLEEHMGLSYILRFYPICIAAAFFLIVCKILNEKQHPVSALWALAFFAFFFTDGLSYAKSRVWHNSFYPTVACASILTGLLSARVDRLLKKHSLATLLFYLCLLVQLILLAYNPADHIPRKEDMEAGNTFIRYVLSLDGEAWIPHHPYYAYLAGQDFHYTAEGSERYYALMGRQPIRRLMEDIEKCKYAHIIIDNDINNVFWNTFPELKESLGDKYSLLEKVDYGDVRFKKHPDHRQDWGMAGDRGAFVPVEGSQFRPRVVLQPKQ